MLAPGASSDDEFPLGRSGVTKGSNEAGRRGYPTSHNHYYTIRIT
jgi:hypothetical protein